MLRYCICIAIVLYISFAYCLFVFYCNLLVQKLYLGLIEKARIRNVNKGKAFDLDHFSCEVDINYKRLNTISLLSANELPDVVPAADFQCRFV